MIYLFLFLFTFPSRYHTYEEMVMDLNRLAHNYPHLSRLETLGYSTRLGLPLLGLKISDAPNLREDEARLLFNGNHHAAEIIGPEICLFLAESLLGQYEINPEVKRFVDSEEIWIVPMVNPDGHWIIEQDIDTLWRKNLRDNDSNGIINLDYDGVDLNRNYNFLWERGNPEPSSREYRGPLPFSENEICALRDLALREKFLIDVCYHSDIDPRRGEYVYFPWLWGNARSPDYFHIQNIACSLAFNIPNDQNTGTYSYIYGRADEGGLARNWFYYALGTFSFTVEVSKGYRPPEERVDSICRKNLRGAYYLMRRALASQITGRIFDAVTGEPLSAEVRILECYAPPETILPRFSDREFGRFRRLLNPGRYTIQVVKDGYEVKTETCEVFFGQPTEINFYLQPSGAEEEFFLPQKDEGREKFYTPDGRLIESQKLRKGIYFQKGKGKTKKIIHY